MTSEIETMSARGPIPVFAVVGHPNEGKSSVVSTLSEDDHVRITPIPGETVVCRSYPVVIDGREIIRFVDTPGFQNPKKTLAWFKAYDGPGHALVKDFRKTIQGDSDFKDEWELLDPIEQGAGIIYVVDGSRPMRSDDRAEMEILRMTGQPRMAVINSKAGDDAFLEDWKAEFRKHFNSVRVFNAHTATYRERIELLESLKAIDQDWHPALSQVILAFKQDWDGRNIRTAELILDMVEQAILYKRVENYTRETEVESIRPKLLSAYGDAISKIEKATHDRIKKRFKHNIFHLDLPPDSVVREGLFDQRTWQVLGLNPKQLIIAAGVAGGVAAGALDVAVGGVSFGVFAALGGLAGAASAWLGGEKMADIKVKGIKIGGYQIRIGPMDNPQLIFVLIDRALLFYAHVINWAHGRRGLAQPEDKVGPSTLLSKTGYTADWTNTERKTVLRYFKMIRQGSTFTDDDVRHGLFLVIKANLDAISQKP